MDRIDRVALIGYRATGKSTVGRLLADHLGLAFVDMDDALVTSFGMDIRAWVELHGWASFREREAELLASLAREHRLVVATGGGVVLREDNRRRLRGGFRVVWLTASRQHILERLSLDSRSGAYRPALTDLSPEEEIRDQLAERNPLYGETAEFELDGSDKGPAELAATIAVRLKTALPGAPEENGGGSGDAS